MPRIAVGVEYDGTLFAGWQSQQGLATVQDAVTAALSQVADTPLSIVGAGRTDAGVHARGQVAHFDTDVLRSTRSWVLGANTQLPPAIALQWAATMPDHFHARYSAEYRSYRYCILNRGTRPGLSAGRVAFVYRPLDVEPMQQAAALLVGEHDFSAFRSAECQAVSPIRRLSTLRVERHGDLVLLEVGANAFLHHMVRNIAGLLIEIGQGKSPPARAAEVLAGRDRRQNAATAPAAGLYLWSVRYPRVFELPGDSDMMPGPTGSPADLLG
ncbi:MAG: tRNA pseudouridine(38-40) synthase TruA [Pseudomonadota bacterium]